MTESAIIAAFMVIQFACLWAAVTFQKAKIGVMDEARVAAWATAIQYCSGSGDISGDIAKDDEETDLVVEILTIEINDPAS